VGDPRGSPTRRETCGLPRGHRRTGAEACPTGILLRNVPPTVSLAARNADHNFRRVAMRHLAVFASCLCLLLAVRGADVAPPTGEPVVAPDANLELLSTRSAPIAGGLTEGPAVAPDGSIYFSDIPFGKDKGMILRFDPKKKETTTFTDDSHKSNGLKFDAK